MDNDRIPEDNEDFGSRHEPNAEDFDGYSREEMDLQKEKDATYLSALYDNLGKGLGLINRRDI